MIKLTQARVKSWESRLSRSVLVVVGTLVCFDAICAWGYWQQSTLDNETQLQQIALSGVELIEAVTALVFGWFALRAIHEGAELAREECDE